MHELKVRPEDLQACTEKSSGVDKMGKFKLGDMVQIDAQNVGVIVRLEKEAFQILNQRVNFQLFGQFLFLLCRVSRSDSDRRQFKDEEIHIMQSRSMATRIQSGEMIRSKLLMDRMSEKMERLNTCTEETVSSTTENISILVKC